MKLDTYIRKTRLSRADLAKKLGISRMSLYRYQTGLRVPNKRLMARIVKLTLGRVQPNDFYA